MPGLPNLYAQLHASHKYRAHLPNAEMRGMRGHMETSRDEKDNSIPNKCKCRRNRLNLMECWFRQHYVTSTKWPPASMPGGRDLVLT